MAEVLFYHLTDSTLEEALPPLLEKSIERGWRVVIQTGSEERRDSLDAHLWAFRDDSFLAHGLETDPQAEDQPIVLTTTDGNANDATVRFVVDGAEPPPLDAYVRGVLMFDGHDHAQVTSAREHWKRLKAEGHAVTYWQQTEGRRWERKA